MKIAIIGAGLTGLVAAYELAKKGHTVEILEKGDHAGGLASDFQIAGQSIEKTYHHIFRTDTDIINLVGELGLADKLEWHDSSMSIYYDQVFYPFNGPVDLLKFSPLPFQDRLRLGLVTLYLQKTTNWKKFTKVSAFDWMSKFAGKAAVNVIWEPLLRGKFHEDYKNVSMAWLWARLHIRANSRKFGEGEKLGYFNGGFSIIITKLVEELKTLGVTFKFNVDVRKFSDHTLENRSTVQKFKDDRKLGIEYFYSGNYEMQIYDTIIATIPSSIFAKLVENSDLDTKIDSEFLSQLNSIKYLGAICLIFSSDQALDTAYWNNINDESSPFLAFINHTKLIPKDRYNNKNIYYLGAYLPHDHQFYSMNDSELQNVWFEYLHKIIPEFDRSQINETFIFKLKNAQHIVDLNYESKIPDYKTPIERVFLSNFSQIFPEDRGTNYAVREGKKIAQLIVNS